MNIIHVYRTRERRIATIHGMNYLDVKAQPRDEMVRLTADIQERVAREKKKRAR